MPSETEAELRREINKLLDFFTEPGQGEKYLRDLEDDLLALLRRREVEGKITALSKLLEYNGAYIGISGKRVDNMVHHDVIRQELAALRQELERAA